ncbi:MAG: AEC family transporter, partial [Pseudacidovorax sp.]|nr:AEC family transporter [Pseudacidovorax sp.]
MLAVLLAAEALGMPPMEPALRLALVLSAAAPMLSIYPILAQPHGQDSLAAASLLATTALSFFTISALLAVLPHLLGV